VENALRTLLANGTYRPGDVLPPQRDLAAEYGVSRDTVQKVLALLAEQRLIVTRQGSGSRVLSGPPRQEQPEQVTLDAAIRAAFEKPEVTLDAYNLTSETLGGYMRVQAERILAGKIAPRSVSVRMLLPSTDAALAYPRAHDPADARIWERFVSIARDREENIRGTLADLRAMVPGLAVVLEIRRIATTPQFKLYVFNDSEMLFGPYSVLEKSIRVPDGSVVPALDVLGLGSTLSYFRRDDDQETRDSRFFASMQEWFESAWNLLGETKD